MWILLSGLIGALAVFFLGWLREWWRNERERRGLLRLLLAEIKHNEILIAAIRDSETLLTTSPYLDALKTGTWDGNPKAVASLPPELLTILVSYYEPLEIFKTLKSIPDSNPDREPQNILETIEMRLEKLSEPLNRLLGLPKDRRESYAQAVLRTQTQAKMRIEGYIERYFLLAPFFLRTERWKEWWTKRRRKNHQGHENNS